jgi:hypothetical protein
MSTELMFLIAVVAIVVILAFSVYGKSGQSNISQHPVDGRSDMPPGATHDTGLTGSRDRGEGDDPMGQHGVR